LRSLSIVASILEVAESGEGNPERGIAVAFGEFAERRRISSQCGIDQISIR
jgi:hypothetical protein